jgi:PEP-CTERM motif
VIKIRTLLAAAAVLATWAVDDARASFTYSVAPVTTSTNFGAGSNLTVTAFNNGATSGVLSGTQNINVAQITQTSTTAPPATDTASIPLAPLVITINNQNGGGSGAFTVNGGINVTRSDTGGAASIFTPGLITPSSLTLDGFIYTLSTASYSPPTIQSGLSGNGSLGYTVTETAVPEPTSFALAGMGFAALGACVYRRRRTV